MDTCTSNILNNINQSVQILISLHCTLYLAGHDNVGYLSGLDDSQKPTHTHTEFYRHMLTQLRHTHTRTYAYTGKQNHANPHPVHEGGNTYTLVLKEKLLFKELLFSPHQDS